MKKISIITVVWNAAAELEITLKNLTEAISSGLDAEIVIIDGGSTDGTVSVAESYRTQIATLVSEPDRGLYDAMNKGIARAKGRYLWFINAGDKIHAPRQLIEYLNSTPTQADIYYGETMVCTTEGQELGLRKKRLPEKLTWKSLQRGMVVCHQSFIVRREIAPHYDLQYRYVADIDWVIKCLKAAKTAENTGLILSEFALGGISTQHRRASLRERWRVMVKHYGFVKTLLAHVRIILDIFSKRGYREPLKTQKETRK